MKMIEKSLMKMKMNQVTNVCKVNIIKVEDFDEVIPIVQVRIGKFEVRHVLLDGGSSVNIISESLKKKLGLKKPQLASFVVHMANQRKVQSMGLIQNLKIDLVACVYKILVTILKMENGVEAYFMFLGRPWLKQVKVHHNWGDNTLTNILDITMTFSMIKHVNIKSSH